MSTNGTITVDEWNRRKKFARFTDDDAALLKGLQGLNESIVDEVLDAFYEHLLAFEETAKFFVDEAVLNRVKSLQKKYFLDLTKGDYGEAYLDSRLKIGSVHARIGLEPRWYLGAYLNYVQLVYPKLVAKYKKDQESVQKNFLALFKIFSLDQEIAF